MINGWKVCEECVIGEERFAIIVNDEDMTAMEAVWNSEAQDWNTDFSYAALTANSDDVFQTLDFESCKQAGYTFLD